MAEEKVKKNKSKFIIAVALIALGVIFNKFTLQFLLVKDGVISSIGKNLVILLLQATLISTGVLLLKGKPFVRFKTTRDPASFMGILGIIFTLALLPPVFGRIFAMAPLYPGEIRGLWIFSLAMLALSFFIIFNKSKKRTETAMMFFSLLFLIFIELAVRLAVNIASPRTKDAMAGLCNRTYPDYTLYTGHPFMQYIYNPAYTMKTDTSAEAFHPFNRFGFKGSDYPYEKPKNTIRIACLGGSTTAHGYPKMMEDYMKTAQSADSVRFECMNFGVSGFSTAHSVVNFALNALDFDPDYIVVLHGWNDEMVRNFPQDKFKSDYSHGFMYYHEPAIPDALPIRISVIYRYMKQALTNEPVWAFLQSATVTRGPDQLSADAEKYKWQNMNELAPYKRNLETILDLALARGIQPALLTMAHTVNPKQPHYYIYPHIDQCNEIARQLAAGKYKDSIIFVDMDSLITGKHDDYFIDLAHMAPEGDNYLAKVTGDAILKDYFGRAAKSDLK